MPYTAKDIRNMRTFVQTEVLDEMNSPFQKGKEAWGSQNVSRTEVEERLRTYIAAGVTLEDLTGAQEQEGEENVVSDTAVDIE